MDDLVAQLFVDSAMSLHDLRRTLSQLLAIEDQDGCLVGLGFEVDVRDNEDRANSRWGGTKDFLRFPYSLEVYAMHTETRVSDQTSFVARLMQTISAMGSRVVVAADFEEALPGGGRL